MRLQLPAGNEDTTDVTGLDTDENGPNTVTNVIVGTFRSSLSFTGNDGPVAYSFLPVLDGTQVLKTEGGNLTSQGANVLFALSGGMLIGSVDVGAPGYVDGSNVRSSPSSSTSRRTGSTASRCSTISTTTRSRPLSTSRTSSVST